MNPFESNAFNMVALTDAINQIPNTYGRAESLGIFRTKPTRFRHIAIEERNGVLNLLPTQSPGAPRPFLKKRLYIHKANLKETPMSTRISVNVFDVKAKHLGPLHQLKVGAKAGRFMFDKAFVATMNAKHGQSIYQRKTKDRFPVREMGISIHEQAMPIVEQTLKDAVPYYDKRLQHHMDFEKRRCL